MNLTMMKEKIAHGNASFPLMVHHFSTDLALTERLNWHWHNELEFLVVTKGEAQFHINEHVYHVKQDDILFINGNQLHSATAVDSLPFHFFAVVFHPYLLDSISNDGIQQKYLTPVYQNQIHFPECISSESECHKEALSLLNGIKDLDLDQQHGYELMIKAKLLTLWCILLSHAKLTNAVLPKENDYRIARIKHVISYIQLQYHSKISIDELASLSGLSEGQFCRFFKEMMNLSAVEYINYYRITQSLSLLSDTDKSISEIASLCGFNNISYFNKVFLHFMHTTPTVYRKGN